MQHKLDLSVKEAQRAISLAKSAENFLYITQEQFERMSALAHRCTTGAFGSADREVLLSY